MKSFPERKQEGGYEKMKKMKNWEGGKEERKKGNTWGEGIMHGPVSRVV